MGPVPRRRDQRGVAVSSPVALLSMAAVVVAGAVFVLTNGDEPDTVVRASASTASSSTPTTSAPATPSAKRPTRHRPPVRRSGTYVEVFNNSGISGLAGSTAARAQGAGWQVVGSDNWYGTIPASTVYYPARLHRQAVLLAKDLGIARLKPSIAPMGGDRLTVILTRDYL